MGSQGSSGASGPAGTAGPPGPPGPSPISTIVTSLVANAVETGGVTTIWGAGFQAGESVTLTVLAVGGGVDKILISAPANDSGAFMVDAEIDLPVGIYTLVGTGSSGSTETSAPLMVAEEK